uniref:Uncharacterized protein n=1 Tax=Cannabis sativa TaxID=3483 RepID=A0A803PB74_CANSA
MLGICSYDDKVILGLIAMRAISWSTIVTIPLKIVFSSVISAKRVELTAQVQLFPIHSREVLLLLAIRTTTKVPIQNNPFIKEIILSVERFVGSHSSNLIPRYFMVESPSPSSKVECRSLPLCRVTGPRIIGPTVSLAIDHFTSNEGHVGLRSRV